MLRAAVINRQGTKKGGNGIGQHFNFLCVCELEYIHVVCMDMRKAGLPECARVFTALWHGKRIRQHVEKSRDKDGEMLGSLTRHKNIFWPIDGEGGRHYRFLPIFFCFCTHAFWCLQMKQKSIFPPSTNVRKKSTY